MNVLTVREARKAFGPVKALDGASFELRQGELLALLGPNGAGKTTLIRAVAGRVRLDAGEIRMFDRVLDGRHTPADLGIVPQEIAVYPLLTARENLEVFGRLHGLAGADLSNQVDWALESTGLGNRSRESVKQFSGGMRRRLNIACGILHRPRVVLLDEPTVGVDPQSRDRIYDTLAALAASGVSLLLTTHHLEEAEARCSRTVIIDHGRVIASGTTPELVDQTVGRFRLVSLRLNAPLAMPDATRLSSELQVEVDAADGTLVRARMRDVALELPPLLETVRAAGRTVDDVEVRGPSLQAVFIHLTGKELREMIATLLRIGYLNLSRDRVALSLKFLLPIVFFSIFASVFGGRGDAQTARINLAVVDQDQSEFSRRLVEGLRSEKALRVRTTADASGKGAALDRATAEQSVKAGDVPVAVVIPRGLGESFARNGFGGGGQAIELLSDVSDPIAPQMVLGLLQKVTMTAAPDLLMQGGLRQFEQYAGAMTPEQKSAVDAWIPKLRARSDEGVTAAGGTAKSGGGMGVNVEVVDVMRANSNRGSLISFYAAGVGVMFLLFSSVAAAGGALLEEAEAGTLERLLSTNMGLTRLLAGKWMFLALGGIVQLTLMFVWGRLVFGLPLFSHLPGFFIMTTVTAAAAAALGLVLATLARTREQLSGFSTILVLVMSALGGSMFPRFLMSESMQKVGLLTFNAWAIDGYLKVFWRDAALWQLWPQVLVLTGLTAVFLGAARMLARRWERA